jgi:hypothetical protein
VFSGYKSYILINQGKVIQKEETNFASLNKIDYGLFNMEAWKDKALGIFTKRLQEFEISSDAYGEVESELRNYLRGIYKDYFVSGKLFDQLFEDAEKNKTIPPVLLNMFRTNLPQQIKNLNIEAQIPAMAKRLAGELKKKEPKIKEVLKSELDNILVDQRDTTIVDSRLNMAHSYGKNSIEGLTLHLKSSIQTHKTEFKSGVNSMFTILALIALLSFILFMINKSMSLLIGSLSLLSIILLICGINLPMIVLDARLNAFSFHLFGQPLSFEEQTIFYQSKSILDVTQNLLEGRTIDLKIVGIMVLCFSVVFPIIKLLLSALYLAVPNFQRNTLIRGMIFHLGKWSMADVFVVALFMAYVGFYGLINSQLDSIENNKTGFAVETVNYTHLEYGALFFTFYCVLSIVIGVILAKRAKSLN